MNSSTSVSEAAAWRRLLWAYPVACVLIAALTVMLITVLDPYDTGRFALFGGYGVPGFGQRLIAASVARAPDTQAAILGNSTMQLIDPARLTERTGWRFVSLTMTYSGPVEQLATAGWLLRHHDGTTAPLLKALVIGMDASWCQSDGKLDIRQPFPFWLYGDSRLEYVWSLANMHGIEAALHKLKLMIGTERQFRPDGYNNFEPEIAGREATAALDLDKGSHPVAATGTGDFAAVPLLRDFFPGVPATTAIALVFMPHYFIDLPVPGSPAAEEEDRCKALFRALATSRPNTTVIDMRNEDDLARDRRNFWDRNHYRMPIARLIENKIAAAFHQAGGV
jgi:hypothetical protein